MPRAPTLIPYCFTQRRATLRCRLNRLGPLSVPSGFTTSSRMVSTKTSPSSVPFQTSWFSLAFLGTQSSPPSGKVTWIIDDENYNPLTSPAPYLRCKHSRRQGQKHQRIFYLLFFTSLQVVESNKPGYITFATAGPNTRTTQVIIANALFAMYLFLLWSKHFFRCSSTITTTRFLTIRDSPLSEK